MVHELRHIVFIPDGNRRWAKQKGLPQLMGHKAGYENSKNVMQWCADRGISEVSFWGFSTENWKRSQEEVSYLFGFVMKAITEDLSEFTKNNVKLQVIGRRSDLPEDLKEAIDHAEAQTANHTGPIMNILLNYGGRQEIIAATKSLIESGVKADQVDEAMLNEHMWSSRMSDPDLIIRTSGEHRTSGCLSWAGAYAELYFADEKWPDFSKEVLDAAIEWYKGRERRFGGNSQLSA